MIIKRGVDRLTHPVVRGRHQVHVGPQCEARIVVAQVLAQSPDVHASGQQWAGEVVADYPAGRIGPKAVTRMRRVTC